MGFSVFGDLVEDTGQQRREFFKFVFGRTEGYICLGFLGHEDRKMHQRFYEWPKQMDEMLEVIEAHGKQLVHSYFGVSLYKSKDNRTKHNIKECTCIWADLDTADPRQLLVKPSIVVQSSPGKYQALWLLEDPVEQHVAEDIARRIAYAHAVEGADKCWDASHVLRIPYTPNLKYGNLETAPIVGIIHAERTLFRPRDFDKYPTPQAFKFAVEQPPQPEEIPTISAQQLFQTRSVTEELLKVFETEPGPNDDWSNKLWYLIHLCQEQYFTRDEAFVIAWESACNKYRRDGRPDSALWHDINKVYIQHIEKMKLAPTPTATIPELLSNEELEIVVGRRTFIERYIDWAKDLTDAATQYHQSGALIILSSLLAGNISLPTSFGTILPNLWFMLLGNTTLTRKTTAMNLAMKLLYEVDDRALLATDGSMEGILVGMRDRPKQPSIFLRDEFSGLLETIAHKDYMAGFAEQLTKLYDGEPLRRLLRKEVIDIRDPVFIMYVGGPKTKTQSLLTEDLVMGGFFPRFVIISAEPDMTRFKPIGPPVTINTEQRELLKNELIEMHNHYVQERKIVSKGEEIGNVQPHFDVALTPAAWRRYNDYETLLTKTALDAGLEYLTPVYDRLAKSTLKAAMLIAASMQRKTSVTVDVPDLLHAIYYARGWREYASETVNGLGRSSDERLIVRIASWVYSNPLGVGRGEIMNQFRLDHKRADLLLRTMEQRKMIAIDAEKRYYDPSRLIQP